MTDAHDKELQAFDEALSALYQETLLSPPSHLDDAIKAKARRAVSSKPASLSGVGDGQRKKGFFQRRELWQVPLSLAAGLMVGIIVIPDLRKDDMADLSSGEMVFMGDQHAESEEAKSLAEQPPEEWIRTIAGLLLQGETKKAELLLIEFNRRFPAFSQEPTH